MTDNHTTTDQLRRAVLAGTPGAAPLSPLTAAAPLLLRALEQLVAAVDEGAGLGYALQTARTAIAQARGEASHD